MLKTNTKKARENIRAYILEHFSPEGYEVNQTPATFEEAAAIILDTFAEEKPHSAAYIYRWSLSDFQVFRDWCQGLPSILDTCYYYNRSAVDDLGAILEETPEEKARFTESEAEERLTVLIWRELTRGAESWRAAC
jgi:hypothetical protein